MSHCFHLGKLWPHPGALAALERVKQLNTCFLAVTQSATGVAHGFRHCSAIV
jgi:hypothetical protein